MRRVIERRAVLSGASVHVHRIAWLGGVYVASALVVKLATSLALLWLGRELPVEQYAAVGLLYALQIGVGSFAGVGIAEVVIGSLKDHRSEAERDWLFRTAVTMFLLSGAFVSGAGWIVAAASGGAMKLGGVERLSAIAAGAVTAFSALQAQMLRLQEHHLRSLSFSFVIPLSMVAMGSLAFLLNRSVAAFFIGEALGGGGMLAALRLAGVGCWSFSLGNPAVWSAFRKVPAFATIAVFGWLSGYGANFMISMLATAPEVATFTILFTVASSMQLLASSFNMVWGPRFYRLVHQGVPNKVERENRRFFLLLGLTLGLAGGVVIAFLPLGLRFFGGNLTSYEAVSLKEFLLLVGYVFVIPWWHCQNYYLVFDKGRELRNNVIVTGVLGVAAWIAAILMFGAVGIYGGFAIQMFLRAMGIVMGARRFWSLGISWEGVFAGVVLCGIGLLISHVWQ